MAVHPDIKSHTGASDDQAESELQENGKARHHKVEINKFRQVMEFFEMAVSTHERGFKVTTIQRLLKCITNVQDHPDTVSTREDTDRVLLSTC